MSSVGQGTLLEFLFVKKARILFAFYLYLQYVIFYDIICKKGWSLMFCIHCHFEFPLSGDAVGTEVNCPNCSFPEVTEREFDMLCSIPELKDYL